MVPAEIGSDLGTDYDWKLRTTEQEFLDGHTVSLNQGKALGGGTILNGMVWTRSSEKDYDVWENLNYDGSQPTKYCWRWADLLPYFLKVRLDEGSATSEADHAHRANRAKLSHQIVRRLSVKHSASNPIWMFMAPTALFRLDFRIFFMSKMVWLFIPHSWYCPCIRDSFIVLTCRSEFSQRHETDGGACPFRTQQWDHRRSLHCTVKHICTKSVPLRWPRGVP